MKTKPDGFRPPPSGAPVRVGALPTCTGRVADLNVLPDYATAGNSLKWFEKLSVDEPAAPADSIRRSMGGEFNMQPYLDMLNRGQTAMSNIDMRSDREGPRHLAAYPDGSYGVPASCFSDLVMSGKTAHPEKRPSG